MGGCSFSGLLSLPAQFPTTTNTTTILGVDDGLEWAIIMQEGGTGLWDMGRLYPEASRWYGGLDWKTWRLDDK